MRRTWRWAVPVAIVLAGTAVIWYVHGRTIDINPPAVVRVVVHPAPEGPTAAPPVSEIADAIPDPLPHPAWQFGCSRGTMVNIELSDGRTIHYGPCRRPASINRLMAAVVDAMTRGT